MRLIEVAKYIQENIVTKIEIKEMNFFYHKKQVVFDLSLNVPANEILAVFGPANSGITTILRSLNRLYELTPGARMEGSIFLDGRNIHNQPDYQRHLLLCSGLHFY